MKKWMASIVLFAALMVLFLLGTDYFANMADEEEGRIQENAIHKACVTCYAVEGTYPPNLKYLEKHYGVRVDREKYAVHYEIFASNIMPIITIVQRDGELE